MKNKALIIAAIITAGAALGMGGVLLYQYQQFSKNLFLNRSTLNGLDVSSMSVDEAYDVVYQDSQQKRLSLTANGDYLVSLELSNFCDITFDKEVIAQGMEEISFTDYLQGKSRSYHTDSTVHFSRPQAEEYLADVFSDIGQEKSRNAKIKKTEKGFTLVEETYGTVVNQKLLADVLEEKIEQIASNEITAIDIADYYKKPKVTAEDLKEDYEKLQEYLSWSVAYKNCKVKIGKKDLLPNISYNNKKRKILIQDEFLKGRVQEVASALNTVGGNRRFKVTSYGKRKSKKAHSGKTITVSGGTYGAMVNTEAEYEKLSGFLANCKSKKNREPEWSMKPQGKGKDDIGDTYIEISLDRQHLWYYVDGKLKMETDVVTGTKGQHDTPTGVYYITERINGKYLVGEGYRTWVNKWMRLTNMGVGLHDATWRGSFGGSIYTYSGSHGCINLPSSFAYSLYDKVYVGLPVIIYDEG